MSRCSSSKVPILPSTRCAQCWIGRRHTAIRQLLPSWHPVVEEAIHNAVNVPYDTSEGAPMMRLINPTYLVASWRIPGANTATRAERAARLKDAGLLDETLLADLVTRFRL